MHARNPGGRHAKPKPDSGFRRRHAFGSVLLAMLMTFVFGTPVAQAVESKSPVDFQTATGDCEATVIDTTGTAPYANARVVVDDGTEVQVAEVGNPVEVGPFSEPTTVHYRYFNGPERNGDNPLWDGHPSFNPTINNYIDSNGTDWILAGVDDPNPFVTWHAIDVNGCATPEVTFTHPNCDEPGLVEHGDVPGVKYKGTPDGQELEHGDRAFVKAKAEEGYILDPEADRKFKFTAVRNPCDGENGADGSDGQDGKDGEKGDTPEPATSDKDCTDFDNVAQVVFHLTQFPGDFDRMDGDDDGFACNSHFGDGADEPDDEDDGIVVPTRINTGR